MGLLSKDEYNKEYCEVVISLGERGCRKNEILKTLGVCDKTYKKWQKTYSEFEKACKLSEINAAAYFENIEKMIGEGVIKGDSGVCQRALKVLDPDTYGQIDPKKEIIISTTSHKSEEDLKQELEELTKKLELLEK